VHRLVGLQPTSMGIETTSGIVDVKTVNIHVKKTHRELRRTKLSYYYEVSGAYVV